MHRGGTDGGRVAVPAALPHMRPHLAAHRSPHRQHVGEHELDKGPAEERAPGIRDLDRHLAVRRAREERQVAGRGRFDRDVAAGMRQADDEDGAAAETVDELSGKITLDSELGVGTTVRILLPSARLVRT